MKYNTLIDAIKAVREISKPEPTVEKNLETGRYEIKFPNTIGLKDAKDMVEAIAALGVQRYLEAELLKAKGATPIIPKCNRCGVELPRYATAQPCDSCHDAEQALRNNDEDIHF